MNVVRSLSFSQEIKEQSVLTTLDAARMALVADNRTFILSFNPSLTEYTNNLCIDIQNVSIPTNKNCSGDELDEESKTFSLEEKLEKVFDRGIKCVIPFHVQRFQKSLLAIIASKSRLIVLIDNFEDTDEAINFQDVLNCHARSALQVPLQSLDSEVVARTQAFQDIFVSKLNVTCACWSESLTKQQGRSHEMAYFAVSHINCFITIWSVDVNGRFSLLCGVDVGDVIDEMIFFTCCNSTYLCTGFRDGRVCLLEFLPPNSGSSWLDVTFIWDDRDYISTNGFVYVEKHQMVAIPKNQYLVLLSFDLLSDNKEKVFLQLDTRFYISGIVPLENELIISTFDGTMFRITLIGDKTLKQELMTLPWDVNEWNIFGIRQSRNNVYLAVACYPSNIYCTRANKQPSKVHYLSLTSTEDVSMLVMNHMGPVCEVFDALCHLKYQLSKGNAWPENIVAYLNDAEAWDDYSIQRLKVIRSLMTIQLLHLSEEKERIIALLKRLEILITTRHISTVFETVSSINLDSLLPPENLSLCIMNYFVGNSSTYSHRLLGNEFSSEMKEFCPICSGAVPPEDRRRGSCSNGHMFARCCQTLLLCSSFPHRTCVVCKSSALQKTDQHPLFDNILIDTCTYCDGRLKLTEGF